MEDSFEEFLGIKFKTMDDGSAECTQRGLIKKTLEAAGMLDCNPNSTPAAPTALGSCKDSEPMNEKWNYRAIVGMLLHLSGNTRPDVALAASQACRFASAPKKPHASKRSKDHPEMPQEDHGQRSYHQACRKPVPTRSVRGRRLLWPVRTRGSQRQVECEIKGWTHCEIRRMAHHLEVSTSVSHLPEHTRS